MARASPLRASAQWPNHVCGKADEAKGDARADFYGKPCHIEVGSKKGMFFARSRLIPSD